MVRKTAISWRNLVHDLAKTGLALAGIGFALVVIFMQLGFSKAVEQTATIVLGKLDFDILIVSKSYVYLADPGTFPIARIRTAESVPGVLRAVPLYVRTGIWQNRSKVLPAEGRGWLPRRHSEGGQKAPEAHWKERAILVLASNQPNLIFAGGIPGRKRGPADLEEPGALLIDRRSSREFGPQKKSSRVELNQQEFHIAGEFEMGTGFSADGAALMNHHNFARAVRWRRPRLPYSRAGQAHRRQRYRRNPGAAPESTADLRPSRGTGCGCQGAEPGRDHWE